MPIPMKAAGAKDTLPVGPENITQLTVRATYMIIEVTRIIV